MVSQNTMLRALEQGQELVEESLTTLTTELIVESPQATTHRGEERYMAFLFLAGSFFFLGPCRFLIKPFRLSSMTFGSGYLFWCRRRRRRRRGWHPQCDACKLGAYRRHQSAAEVVSASDILKCLGMQLIPQLLRPLYLIGRVDRIADSGIGPEGQGECFRGLGHKRLW